MRVEHCTTAGDHGTHVARNLLAGPEAKPFADPGYVWSDQYGVKLQLIGLTHHADEVMVVDGDVDSRRFVAWYRRGERLVGVLGMSSPRLVMQTRQLIERRTTWTDALETVSG